MISAIKLTEKTAVIITALSDEDAGRMFKAVTAYVFMGEEPSFTGLMALQWTAIKKELDISRARAEAGRRGAEKTNSSKPAEPKPVRLKADPEKQAEKKAEKQALIERFNAFWAAYPKHVGKPAALKKFEAINPDDALLTIMLDAIAKQRQCAQWSKDNGQYIPHPATWLHQHRWEDEVQPQTAETGERYNNPFADLLM